MTITTGAFDPSRSWRFATRSCKPMARGHTLISYAACCGTLMLDCSSRCSTLTSFDVVSDSLLINSTVLQTTGQIKYCYTHSFRNCVAIISSWRKFHRVLKHQLLICCRFRYTVPSVDLYYSPNSFCVNYPLRPRSQVMMYATRRSVATTAQRCQLIRFEISKMHES